MLAQADEWLSTLRRESNNSTQPQQTSDDLLYYNQQLKADAKYNLPRSFYKQNLAPVPDQLTLEELEDYVTDYENEESFEILFEMWCQSLRDCFKSKESDLSKTASGLLGIVVDGLYHEGGTYWDIAERLVRVSLCQQFTEPQFGRAL